MQNPDLMIGEPIALRHNVSLQVCYSSGRLPALVFLHGGLGNRFNWRSQYEFFQQQGQTVLAYDLAGHGQSTPYNRYSIGRHCRDLTRLLQQFQIQSPILCCHSYGVPIGLEWSQQNAVSSLVLIGGGTHALDPWWEIPLMQFLTWGGRHFYRIPVLQALTNQVSSRHRHSAIRQFLQDSPVPINVHPYQALRIFWGYNFFDRYPVRHSLRIPVIVMTGEQDTMFTHAMGAELASSFAQGKHLPFQNAGHLLMAEYPEAVNSAIAHLL